MPMSGRYAEISRNVASYIFSALIVFSGIASLTMRSDTRNEWPASCNVKSVGAVPPANKTVSISGMHPRRAVRIASVPAVFFESRFQSAVSVQLFIAIPLLSRSDARDGSTYTLEKYRVNRHWFIYHAGYEILVRLCCGRAAWHLFSSFITATPARRPRRQRPPRTGFPRLSTPLQRDAV